MAKSKKTRHRKPKCHKDKKKRFKSRRNAARMARKDDRIYYCSRCGGFHITTTPIGVASEAKKRTLS